jgi:MFS family permease
MPSRKTRRRSRTTQDAPGPAASRSLFRVHRWLFLAIVVVLFATTDDRHVGLVTDGRQMAWTAIAITETGTIGQARARDLTFPRDGGDSVSRYGMAMSLAQIPAAWLAPRVEARLGAASAQPLFLIAPFLFVLAAAVFAGTAARELVRLTVDKVDSVWAERVAILLSTLASPLGVYAAIELSEPLQAAALSAAFAAALIATRLDDRRMAAAAGISVGVAVLTKSSLLFVTPLALLPLVSGQHRWRHIAAAAAGFVPVGAGWLTIEVWRFGNPFASYAGERFSHSFFDGFWRLLVGVNKGLLLYFPALIAVVMAITRAIRGRRVLFEYLGAALPFIALLALAAPWWAWHGVGGWGPRLIVPAIPLLAAVAAVEIARWRRSTALSLLVVSLVANLPPLLQHPIPVLNYMWSCAWPQGDAATADSLPPFTRRMEGGRVLIPPDHVLSEIPEASPFVLQPWFFYVTHQSDEAAAALLQSPPWISARPDIRPLATMSPEDARALTRRPRWNVWGRGFWPEPPDARYASMYDWGLSDQVIRAQQQRRTDIALMLAMKLTSLAPDGYADALLLESYRLLKRDRDAAVYLSGLSHERRAHPAINVVLALWERDDGNEQEARNFLRSVADRYPDSPLQAAVTAPLNQWPSDFGSMTADPSLEISVNPKRHP